MEVMQIYASFCLAQFGLSPIDTDGATLPAEFLVPIGNGHFFWSAVADELREPAPPPKPPKPWLRIKS